MPWSQIVRPVHDKTDGAWSVTFAQHVSDLTVCHHPALGNATNDPVDSLAILMVGLFKIPWHCSVLQNESAQTYSETRKTTRAGAPSPAPSAIFNGKQISS